MSNPSKQKDLLWLSAMRAIGFHFSKIGDIIAKCAEDTEKLMHQQMAPAVPEGYATKRSDVPRLHRDDDRRPSWAEPPRPLKSRHESESFARYNFPTDRNPHLPPPQPYPLYYHPDYMPMHLRRGGYDAEDGDGRPEGDKRPTDIDMKRKRRASTSAVELEASERGPVMAGPAGRPLGGRKSGGKRIRINWSHSENTVFFDTIEKFATEDESTVLREIVAALKGSRNWVQCKGHFRNLQFVGRIAQTDTEPKRWVVTEGPKPPRLGAAVKKSTTSGKDEGRESVEKTGEDDDQKANGTGAGDDGGEDVAAENGDDDKNEDNDGDEDEDEEEDDAEGDDDNDEDYQDMDEENGEGGQDSEMNGHPDRKGAKKPREALNDDNLEAEPTTRSPKGAKGDVRKPAEKSPRRAVDEDVEDRPTGFDPSKMAVPFKKQTTAGQMSMLPQLRPRDARDKRRYGGEFRAAAAGDMGRFGVRK